MRDVAAQHPAIDPAGCVAGGGCLVFLDVCHCFYLGDRHPVLEHFYQSGARLVGLTAMPG